MQKGFLLVGSSTMVCQSDGQTAKWSLDDTDSAPVCKCIRHCLMCTIFWVEFLLSCANNIYSTAKMDVFIEPYLFVYLCMIASHNNSWEIHCLCQTNVLVLCAT